MSHRSFFTVNVCFSTKLTTTVVYVFIQMTLFLTLVTVTSRTEYSAMSLLDYKYIMDGQSDLVWTLSSVW